jgi:hypothetical protein
VMKLSRHTRSNLQKADWEGAREKVHLARQTFVCDVSTHQIKKKHKTAMRKKTQLRCTRSSQSTHDALLQKHLSKGEDGRAKEQERHHQSNTSLTSRRGGTALCIAS